MVAPAGIDLNGTNGHSSSLQNNTAFRGSGTLNIRPYSPKDRLAVRKLCCDTGLLGEPIDAVFQDREAFADLFTGAYLDHEPDSALVAEASGRIVGYLLGAIHPRFDRVLMRNGFPVATKLVWKLMSGKYAHHCRSRQFVRWLLTAGLRQQPRHPANAAHLHFNLANEFRGRGLAWELWKVFEKKLHIAGVKGCYGSFFSHPRRRPEAVYARYGFTIYDRKRTTMFHPEFQEVEVVCVSKALGNGTTPAGI